MNKLQCFSRRIKRVKLKVSAFVVAVVERVIVFNLSICQIFFSHCLQNSVLVLPYGAAALWETEEAEGGAGEGGDGPGECETN